MVVQLLVDNLPETELKQILKRVTFNAAASYSNFNLEMDLLHS
jgi:hypothetical protein